MITELLSPAGSPEALNAAVENGADAVYLGGRLFNARQYASNFDDLQLEKAIDYAHLRNVKVYLTLNTLIKQDELEEAVSYAARAYNMGIDAAIVQDLGFALLLKEFVPGLRLHASTQMTSYSCQGAELLYKLGFERVVLARELSLKEISEIKSRVPIQTEIFIHGALCICYSGQCLLSSSIGKSLSRSGNRGTCAQPCRMKYSLCDNFGKKIDDGYLLSAKDINSIEFLKNIIESGADSLKIEGRMKSPEYVGIITSKYRKALDYIQGISPSNITENDIKEICQIFNRGGFSKGYFYGKDPLNTVYKKTPKNMGLPLGKVISANPKLSSVFVSLEEDISIGDGIEILTESEKKPGGIISGISLNGKLVKSASKGQTATLSRISLKDSKRIPAGSRVIKTSDKELLTRVSQTYREGSCIKKIPLDAELVFRENAPLEFTLRSENISFSGKSLIFPVKAVSSGITRESLSSRFLRTDTFPFLPTIKKLTFEENLFIPVSEINRLRRHVYSGISELLIKSGKPALPANSSEIKLYSPFHVGSEVNASKTTQATLYFFLPERLKDVPQNILRLTDNLLIPLNFFTKKNTDTIKRIKALGVKITALLPPVTKETDQNFKDANFESADAFMAGTLGAIELIKNYGKPVYGDYGLNIFNSFSVKALEDMRISKFSLSPESDDIGKNIFPAASSEITVYGKIPVMVSEYCPIGAHYGKYKCKAGAALQYCLVDKKGEKYPILCDSKNCRPQILSSGSVDMTGRLAKLRNQGYINFRINIYNEDFCKTEEILWKIKKL